MLSLSAPLAQQEWLAIDPVPNNLFSRVWRDWLLDSGSLTKRLKALPNGTFSVKPLSTRYGRPTLSEAKTLGLPLRAGVYIREVALCLDETVAVYARSIIPMTTLVGEERKLLTLKNKSMGEILFSHKRMRRGPMQLKLGSINHEPTWARRSAFYLNEKPLLVSEFFTRNLLEMINQ